MRVEVVSMFDWLLGVYRSQWEALLVPSLRTLNVDQVARVYLQDREAGFQLVNGNALGSFVKVILVRDYGRVGLIVQT